MKFLLVIFILHLAVHLQAQHLLTDKNYITVSQQLLYAVRTGDSSNVYVNELAGANQQQLMQQLKNDADKKAFWLNLYNAFVQRLLTTNPDQYKSRNGFFTKKQIVIAGKNISLDDIEHGFLRRSKIKWSLGYFNKIFPSSFEKNFRAEKLDNRIHFALNCGAKSCPPIAYYHPEKIDAELELAAENYLRSETDFSTDSTTIYLPKIMSWFRRDFHGKKGIKRLLKNYKIVNDKHVHIKFKKYDWSLFLNNYKDHN